MIARFDNVAVRYAGAALAWTAVAAAADDAARRLGLALPPWWSALGLALASALWLQHRLGPRNPLAGATETYCRLAQISSDGVFYYRGSKLVAINAAGRRLLSIDPDTDVAVLPPSRFGLPLPPLPATPTPCRLRRADGDSLETEISGLSFGGNGGRSLLLVRDLPARRARERRLHERNRGLRMLCRRLLDNHEVQQRRIAAELHDEIGQLLTVLKLQLRAVEGRASALDQAEALVNSLMACVRDLSVTLNPPHLRQLGLAGALRDMAQRLSPTVAIALREPEPIGRFDPRLETAGFRVAQEAVTNALRHAGARHVEIELRRLEGQLIVSVSDDGAGFDVADAHQRGGIGLLGMRERALAVGGQCSIRSSPGVGTFIELRLPFTIPGSPD